MCKCGRKAFIIHNGKELCKECWCKVTGHTQQEAELQEAFLAGIREGRKLRGGYYVK